MYSSADADQGVQRVYPGWDTGHGTQGGVYPPGYIGRVYPPGYPGVLYPPGYPGVLYPPWYPASTPAMVPASTPTMVHGLYTHHGTRAVGWEAYTPVTPSSLRLDGRHIPLFLLPPKAGWEAYTTVLPPKAGREAYTTVIHSYTAASRQPQTRFTVGEQPYSQPS